MGLAGRFQAQKDRFGEASSIGFTAPEIALWSLLGGIKTRGSLKMSSTREND